MTEKTISESFDIEVLVPTGGLELPLTVSPRKTVRDVLRAAGARFHVLDEANGIETLQLRREGSILPLDPDLLAEGTLSPGDRLILERMSPRNRRLDGPGGSDSFAAATTKAAADALSPDSAKFLEQARQVVGE